MTQTSVCLPRSDETLIVFVSKHVQIHRAGNKCIYNVSILTFTVKTKKFFL